MYRTVQLFTELFSIGLKNENIQMNAAFGAKVHNASTY